MRKLRTIALILSFMLVLSSFSFTAYALLYDEYTVVNGTMERTSTSGVYVGDTVEVYVKVDFDTNNLTKIVAFDLIGKYTNLTLTEIEYLGDVASSDIPNPDEIDLIASLGNGSPQLNEPVKTNKSTIINTSASGKISYTAISFPNSTFITEGSDGVSKLVKLKFTASSSGIAKIELNDCYVRADYNYDENDHRNLVISDLSFNIATRGTQGGGGSGSSRPSLPPAIVVPPEPDVPDQPGITGRKYADIYKSDWYYDNIDKLYDAKYVNGTGVESDGAIIISPSANITRQEAAKLAVSALELQVLSGIPGFSDDNAAADWAKDYIYTASANEKKIVKGYPEDNTFRPFNNITRAEFATIMMNTFDFEMLTSYDLTQFKDCEDITWAAPYVASLVKEGIIKGYEDGCFYPNKYITRAEAFTMMYRALDYFGKIK